MKARLISVLLVIALLVTVGIVAVQADNTDPIAVRNAIAANYPTMAEVQAVGEGYCPFCGTSDNTWQALPAVDGSSKALATGHYYVAESLTANKSYYSVAAGNQVCVHLNGKDITSTDRVFQVAASSSAGNGVLAIMGNGIVTGGGTNGSYGATLHSTSTMHLCGGTYKHASTTSRPTAIQQAAHTRGAINIYDGAVFTADADVYGPNIYLPYGTIDMYGGEICNAKMAESSTGTNKFGGNIKLINTHASVNSRFRQYGGSIYGGKAHHGGNIGLYTENKNGAQFVQEGGSVYGGETYSGGSGGNIYACSAKTTVTIGSNVYGGTAKNYGGNIATANGAVVNIVPGANIYNTDVAKAHANLSIGGSTQLNISGGTVDGGINFTSTGELNISGAPMINATNGGLNLDSGKVITVGEMSEGASVKVTPAAVDATVTAAFADANAATAALAYFGAANAEEYMLEVDTIAKTLKYVEVPPAGECPICGVLDEAWAALPTNVTELADGGHYEVTSNMTVAAAYTVAGTACVRLQNANLTSESTRVFDVSAGKTLNVMGTGTITGGDNTIKAEGVKDGDVVTKANLNLSGVTLKHTGTNPTLYVGSYVDAKLDGVTLTADQGVTGVNLHAGDCTMEVKNCLIENGVAPSTYKGGGNVYAISADIDFIGTTIRNGIATEAQRGGGNIYTETGVLKYSNTKVQSVMPNDITATTAYTAADGGSIYHRSGSATFYDGSEVSGGYAEASGGAIYVYAGTVNFVDGTFTGGKAHRGAFLCQQTANSIVWICGGTYNEGVVAGDRGKTFLARGGALYLTGGTFNSNSHRATSADSGCAIQIASTGTEAKLILTEHTTSSWAAPEVVINDPHPAYAIRISSNAASKLEIRSRFNDSILVNAEESDYGATYTHGSYAVATGVDYTGSVGVGPLGGALLLPDGNGGLVVAGAKVDGQWVAADAVTNGTNVKLYADATMTLADDANSGLVDLNGKNLTVTGTGTFTGFNSSTAKASQVTLNGVTTEDETTWNDAGYYNVVLGGEEGAYTYHKLEVKINAIALRTSEKGLYYRSMVNTDDTLRGQITNAGIFLGVAANKDAVGTLATAMQKVTNFEGKNEFTYDPNSGFRAATIEIGSDFDWEQNYITSVLVKNIFKVGADNNKARGEYPIVGVPYVVLGDDTVLTAQTSVDNSMQDYMEKVNNAVDKLTDTQLETLQAFCDKWDVDTFGWAVSNIMPAPSTEPEEQV